ncbi:MAG: UvrD-helicase domain-containing protein [Deltaproteobacteria bacterium]|nr:UvrD-helicase domain-containing protein [Deltaproteobacteria bacterium]
MDLLQDLNPEQIAAVTATEGPVRVAAGPGAGKTRTLTRRFCWLVGELGVSPRSVLCATFTNRAASEMKSRIRALIGDLDLGRISTIHGFCLQLLKEDIHVLGWPKNFTIFDSEDQKDLLNKIFLDMNLTSKEFTIKRAQDEVLEARKLQAESYVEYFHLLNNEILRLKFKQCADFKDEIFLRYLYEQKKSYGLDFNDLINLASYILKNFEEVRVKWQQRLQYVMVDEFQDVSARQYHLAALLAAHHGNLFIVGDPDQTIYSWRGSHVKLFVDFPQKHPGTVTVELTRNYRSTPEILAAAGAVIARNQVRHPLTLSSQRASGPRPVFRRAADERGEADWIRDRVKELAAAGEPLSNCAVIYRAHHRSRSIEESFIAGAVPYRLFSGVAFYGRAEIKTCLAYLRMVAYGDDVSFRRTVNLPPRRFGKTKLQRLTALAEGSGRALYAVLKDNLGAAPFKASSAADYARAVEAVRADARAVRRRPGVDELLQKLLDLSGYEAYLRGQGDQERLDNVAELKQSAAVFAQDEDATLEGFLDRAALFSNLDRDSPADAVKLMTIHAAKGLEFSNVFLCGLSEGSLPSSRAQTPEDLEEERRLCYVAMTRAMNRLYLTDSAGYGHDSGLKSTSRFVIEAGPETVDFLTPPEAPPSRPPVAAQAGPRPTAAAGDRIRHRTFGPGTILSVDEAAGAYVVQFDGLPTTRSLRFDAPWL